MAVKYLDSKYQIDCARDATYVTLTDVYTPVFVKLDSIAGDAANESLSDIVVVDPTAGTLIPRVVFGSKAGGNGVLVYREPSCDASNGGYQVSIQYGGASVDVANDPATFESNFSVDANAIYAYLMEQSSGTIVDSADNHNSTVEANITYAATGLTGKAIDFNGANSYFNISETTELRSISEFTFIGSMYFRLWDALKGVFAYYESEAKQIQILQGTYGAGSLDIWIGDGTDKAKCIMAISSADALNKWGVYGYCFDGSQTGDENRLVGYFNGTQKNIVFQSQPVPATTQSISDTAPQFGNSVISPNVLIDTTIMYDKALCGSRMADLSNNQHEYATNGTLVLSAARGFVTQTGLSVSCGISL